MKSLCFAAATAVAALVGLASPQSALAWGEEGHAIIAQIAQDHLTPAAQARVAALLKFDGATNLAAIASWADQIRSQRPETAPWHFVDIPLKDKTYSASRDCSGGNCVVQKIKDFETTLAGSTAVNETQFEALAFLVHFIGDVHQPLHAEDNNDEGGNEITVTNKGKNANLHSCWDTTFIVDENPDTTDFANTLNDAITSTDIKNFTSTTSAATWANEAHALAQSVAYSPLNNPTNGSKVSISATYEDNAQSTIELQLSRAGIRLAAALNTALK